MHSRKELEISAIVSGLEKNTFEYKIVKVIGKGANSIVYEAHYSDSNNGDHLVHLKECYPYTSSVKRIGDALVWKSEAQKENDFAKFKNAYHKLLNMQNSSNISNSTAHTFDLIEANGTLYSIMDATEGKTFDEDKTNNLVDVLKTVRALAKVVGEYHNNGYLHLDIKPSNFLTIPETRELVVLFDVDSVTSIDEIKAGLVKCVPFSSDWAAPEQLQVKIKKLCRETDIFSIGAVLFEKVMERKFDNEDMAPFANWEFKGEKFDKVNPKIQRLLSEIFHKTLSANIKRRFKSCDELIAVLDEAISISSIKTFIIPSSIQSKNFIGRKEDLKEIDSNLRSNNNLFIHGFAGTGKTELAREYAIQNKEDFDTIVFCRYNGSLITSLQRIPVANFEDYKDNFKSEFEKLCDDDRLLIILDNYDVDADYEQDDLEYFLNLNCKKIVTTRTDFNSRNDIEIHALKSLDFEDALELFKFHSGIKEFSNEDILEIKAIFVKVAYNTLFICRLAKEISSRGLTVSKLAVNVMSDLLKNIGKAEVYKDGRIGNTTIYDLAKELFKLERLSQEELQAMRNLYILRWRTVNLSQYREIACLNIDELTEEQAIDTLISLESRGFIESSQPGVPEREIYLHSIVLELVFKELCPSVDNCSEIANYYQNEIKNVLSDNDKSIYVQCKNQTYLEMIFEFYKSLDIKEKRNFEYIIDSIYISYVKTFYSSVTLSNFFLEFSRGENFAATLNVCDNIIKFKAINTLIWSKLNCVSHTCSSALIFDYEIAAINYLSGIHEYCLRYPNKENINYFVEGVILFSKHFETFYVSGEFKSLEESYKLSDILDFSAWTYREKKFLKIEEYIYSLKEYMTTEQKKMCLEYFSHNLKQTIMAVEHLSKPDIKETQKTVKSNFDIYTESFFDEEKNVLFADIERNDMSICEKVNKVKLYYSNGLHGSTTAFLHAPSLGLEAEENNKYVFLTEFLSKYGSVFDESIDCFNYIRWMYACLSLKYNVELFHENMKILMKQLEEISIQKIASTKEFLNIWTRFDEVYDFFEYEMINPQLISKYILPYIKDYLSFCESLLDSKNMDKKEWYCSVYLDLKVYSSRHKSKNFLTLFNEYEKKYHKCIGVDYTVIKK